VSGLANIEVPRGPQAVQAWRRLDRRTRRDVTRLAQRGIGHPDPQVAAIAVGRAQATLQAPLWRWALVVVASLLIGWPLTWGLGLLLGGLDDQWIWFSVPISSALGMLVVLRVQARQLERANLATLDWQ
jgi:hypothetical protein